MPDEIEPTVPFGREAVVVVPDAFHKCPGAKLITNRDAEGRPGVIVNLLLGERVQVIDGRAPTHGELRSAAVLVNPEDARALARELNNFADLAEKS
jgi:hypothetical protein